MKHKHEVARDTKQEGEDCGIAEELMNEGIQTYCSDQPGPAMLHGVLKAQTLQIDLKL
jgi:hypothetical protein